jgi:hypothetical protein
VDREKRNLYASYASYGLPPVASKTKFRFVFCHDPFAFSLVPKTLIATPTSGRFVEALRM